MKTNFNFLWPWFRWKSGNFVDTSTFKGVGFPTEISYLSMYGEWHFELQILGFGFGIERFPTEALRKATDNLLKAVEEKNEK